MGKDGKVLVIASIFSPACGLTINLSGPSGVAKPPFSLG